MNDQHDRDLRAAFDTLRRETEAGLAAFRRPNPAPARRRVAWHFRPLLATGVLAATIAGVVIQRRAMERREIIAPFLTSTEWQSPTDYLLTTPGQALLSAVPTIGSDSGTTIDSAKGTPQ